LQFDNSIAAYISAIPLLLLSVFLLLGKLPKSLVIVTNILYIALFAVVFTISISDIPYFSYFFSHIGISAFGWFEFGSTTAGIVFQEKAYYPYLILAPVSIGLFAFGVIRLGKQLRVNPIEKIQKREYKFVIPMLVFIWGLCGLGMRGSFQEFPLRIGYAYFSNNSFCNQLGINPAFYLLKNYSVNKRHLHNIDNLMPVDDAIRFVQKELKIELPSEDYPVARKIIYDGEVKKPNIVWVLLESLSTNFLTEEYNGQNLMPFFNDLISKSYYFRNFYSAGTHTNNGIFASLYGYPALFNEQMLNAGGKKYTGLSYHLHKQGYRNLFFLTSNPNYDHMNSFLLDNHFDRIYSIYDYPKDKIVNNFGIQDDFLFEYGIKELNNISKQDNAPFFSVFLTVSNHPPYVIPEQFKNAGDTDEKRIIAFVDNSLKNFMENAAKEEWYKNTLFVFLGDHGAILGKQIHDMPLSYNHIPCLIYSPLLKDAPKQFDQFGGQIDLFPTLMGLLNYSYTNHSLGIDLLKEKRPYMFFVSDNQLGCIDDDYFYVRNLTNNFDFLYDLHNETDENVAEKYPAIFTSMKDYATSMLITANYLIKNNKTAGD
jgi:phosphoglycerol transferase MdoB-like AlkP superfamily enzyme